MIDLDIRLANGGYTSEDQFSLELQETWGWVIERDNCILPDNFSGTYVEQYYCPRLLSNGQYQYVFDNNSVHDLCINYKIYTFSCVATTFSPEIQELNMIAGQDRLVKINPIPSTGYLVYENISSSNNSVAEVYWDRDGIYVSANRAGTCYINVVNSTGFSKRINITVTNPSTPKLRYTSYKMCKGETLQNELRFTSSKVSWSSSNKKVATVSKNGKITAKKVGKAIITAKVGNKKYKCKINIVRQEPDFFAYLADYNTRSNYFEVNFLNQSNKSVTIYSSGAKVMHVAYKAYDRNLRMKKRSVVVKPHKSITIRFYVKGRVTWYDYERYTLQYKFKFDGVSYIGHTWDEDSVYKRGKKWYNTYWDEQLYQDWII